MKMNSKDLLKRFVKMLNSNKIINGKSCILKFTDRTVTDQVFMKTFHAPRYKLAIYELKTSSTGMIWFDIVTCIDNDKGYGTFLMAEDNSLEMTYERLLKIILGKKIFSGHNFYQVPETSAELELMLSIEGF